MRRHRRTQTSADASPRRLVATFLEEHEIRSLDQLRFRVQVSRAETVRQMINFIFDHDYAFEEFVEDLNNWRKENIE